jgi:hypothetical protein
MQTIFSTRQSSPLKRTLRFSLFILSPALVIGMAVFAFRNMQKTMTSADRDVKIFRQELDAGQFAAIYDAASESFVHMLSAIHDKM